MEKIMFKIMLCVIFVSTLLCSCVRRTYLQVEDVTGFVKHYDTGQPIKDVVICYERFPDISVTTDKVGFFSLSSPLKEAWAPKIFPVDYVPEVAVIHLRKEGFEEVTTTCKRYEAIEIKLKPADNKEK